MIVLMMQVHEIKVAKALLQGVVDGIATDRDVAEFLFEGFDCDKVVMVENVIIGVEGVGEKAPRTPLKALRDPGVASDRCVVVAMMISRGCVR